MNEHERRIEAIRRMVQGEKVSDICVALGRSRRWLHKWAGRFEADGIAGLEDGRRQNGASSEVAQWLRELIIETRDRLEREAEAGESFVGMGAEEVVRQLAGLGVELPSGRTVHRILVAAGRVPVDRECEPVNYCPRPSAETVNSVHQIDIWPRLLTGGRKVNFLHLVDVASWYPYGWVCGDKRTDTVLAFLWAAWQQLGLPQLAQFDNEMTFTGGRWAHRLGRVVRLCLALGVQVWFIPLYTAQRNGFVESFHSQCHQFLWSRHTFGALTDVRAKYPAFLQAFRQEHHLPAIAGQTPQQARGQRQRQHGFRPLPVDFRLAQPERLPIVAGLIHCVRLADRQGTVNILNRQLQLGEAYARHYVLATIHTARQQMCLFQQPDADSSLQDIGTFSFPLPEPAVAYDPSFNYLLDDS
jgi:transposase